MIEMIASVSRAMNRAGSDKGSRARSWVAPIPIDGPHATEEEEGTFARRRRRAAWGYCTRWGVAGDGEIFVARVVVRPSRLHGRQAGRLHHSQFGGGFSDWR